MLNMIVVLCGVLVTAWFALPVLSDVLSLIRPRAPRGARGAAEPASRLLFLVPAHDEERLIGDCVRAVQALQYPAGHTGLIVLADNCTDRTAEIARELGAECMERSDATRRGKPHAVAWALERIDLTRYDGVVILDADAVVDPGYASALDRRAPLRHKALECYDDVRNRTDGAVTRMAAVLSAARSFGAYRLKQRAGLNIPVGDGMCIGTGVLRAHPWKAFGLSEDWEVYALLTSAGVPIEFAPDARLYAQEEQTLRHSSSQRQRWLVGRFDALARLGPALLRSRAIGAHQKLDVIAELSAPGPAGQLGVVVVTAAALMAVGATTMAVTVLLTLARPIVYTLIGLRHAPEPGRAMLSFAYLPFYAMWRVANMVASVRLLRRREWVRTARV